jgi:hypothetical protein
LDELSLFKEKYGSVTSILRVAELKHEEIEKTLAELKEIKKPAKRD